MDPPVPVEDVGATRVTVGVKRAATTAVLTLVLATLAPDRAEADEATGTWTGSVEARGNYYWETSTRVMAPEISGQVSSPTGVRLNAGYLVDAITSASIGAGARSDILFTEVRHDVSAGVGKEFALSGKNGNRSALDLSFSAHGSREPDYRSLGGTLAASWSVDERNTVFHGSVTGIHDDVQQRLRGINPATGGQLMGATDVGNLDGVVLRASVDRVISPRMTTTAGYDYGYLTGFLANPYRLVTVDGFAQGENHPGTRHRHTVYGRVAWYLPTTRTAVHGILRVYRDSWDVTAVTPEVRAYQEFGDVAYIRLRYRYYGQTASSFYRSSYTIDDQLWTADPKMEPFESHLVGGLVSLELNWLEGTPLQFLAPARGELSFDWVQRTNRYGNGVISQAALRFPF